MAICPDEEIHGSVGAEVGGRDLKVSQRDARGLDGVNLGAIGSLVELGAGIGVEGDADDYAGGGSVRGDDLATLPRRVHIGVVMEGVKQIGAFQHNDFRIAVATGDNIALNEEGGSGGGAEGAWDGPWRNWLGKLDDCKTQK